MTADGTYSVRSKFDLATNAPGAVGDVVNVIIDATDSGDDPANWLLEQMINQLPSGTDVVGRFQTMLYSALVDARAMR